MKKVFALVCFVFLLIGSSFSQDDKKGLGRVVKRQGIEIYVMSEPVREYTVTGSVNKDDFSSVINALSGKKDERTIIQMIDVLINNANRKQKKGKLEFDAILTEDGQTGTLIKFKEEKKE